MSDYKRMTMRAPQPEAKAERPASEQKTPATPSAGTIRYGFVITTDLLERMRDVCDHEGISMAELVRQATTEYIQRLEQHGGPIPPRRRQQIKKGRPYKG
jgi:hypothetical protein